MHIDKCINAHSSRVFAGKDLHWQFQSERKIFRNNQTKI